MDTIQTIHSLLLCNGSARPVMVALTPSEKALIAEAPAMAEALESLLEWTNFATIEDSGDRKLASEARKAARAILARIKGETP
jgi:hypothetical protein